MRLPVNVARGFTPVSEVDIDDDRRPSTVMTAMASFSGEPWHHASLPPTRRHSLRLPVKPCGSPPEADCDNNGVFSVNAARSCHYAGLPCWSARHVVCIPVRCSMTMLVKIGGRLRRHDCDDSTVFTINMARSGHDAVCPCGSTPEYGQHGTRWASPPSTRHAAATTPAYHVGQHGTRSSYRCDAL